MASLSTPPGWASLLAAMGMLLAVMQGILGLESSAPCRISRRKLRFLLAIQIAQSCAVLASVLVAFNDADVSLTSKWPTILLLVAGVMNQALDTLLTLRRAADGRVHWLPISEPFDLGDIVAFAALAPTVALLCTLLALWPSTVNEHMQLTIGGSCSMLITGGLSISALVIYLAWECYLVIKSNSYSLGWAISPTFRDAAGLEDSASERNRPVDSTMRHVYQHLHDMELRKNGSIKMRVDGVNEEFKRVPLHLRGAIVSVDNENLRELRQETGFWIQQIARIIARLSLVPFLIWAVVEAARQKRVTSATTSSELSTLATVLALADASSGLKFALWGVEGYAGDEDGNEL